VTPLAKEALFDLVDELLVAAGRGGLTADGPQRKIIEILPDDQVLQILAGPGAGKTEMLVWRILYELFVCGTDSSRVMVTTFTNKAATELSVRLVERADALLALARDRGLDVADPHVHDVRVGTLHSLCDTLLAEFDEGYMAAATEVIDEIETRVRLARNMRWVFRSATYPDLLGTVLRCEPLVALFRAPWKDSSWPTRVVDQVTYLMSLLAQQTETWTPRCGMTGQLNGVEVRFAVAGLTEWLAAFQRKWQQYLDSQQVLDFATIQKRFLERQSSIVSELDHIFVDEFQDTNPIQFEIHTNWVRAAGVRLTVVGDDDQGLYRFRGSDIQCFIGLEAACLDAGARYRLERLEKNWRSTGNIVKFSQEFKGNTVLRPPISMKKRISPGTPEKGEPVRLLQGAWLDICRVVADEVAALGAGRVPDDAQPAAPTVALLMFSTSERSSRRADSPATQMRAALESLGLRVDNPRNKMAAAKGSPVYELLALISYLIDPVTKAPAGVNGHPVEVWASCSRSDYARWATSARPGFNVADDHASIQKGFRKQDGTIGTGGSYSGPLLAYVDEIRDRLLDETRRYEGTGKNPPRLTLSGFVARLLSFPQYRRVGFTPSLFREALFTALLESNIAPSRRTTKSLDEPLMPTVDNDGLIVWGAQFWTLLNTFGTIVNNIPMDDPEVEAFSDNAVAMLTFHQAKGLEFDHVYVALTGRDPSPNAVLQTLLFSGDIPEYTVEQGVVVSKDQVVVDLAEADRAREVYVALTRAKKALTILDASDDDRTFMNLHEAIEVVFADIDSSTHPTNPHISVRSFAQ